MSQQLPLPIAVVQGRRPQSAQGRLQSFTASSSLVGSSSSSIPRKAFPPSPTRPTPSPSSLLPRSNRVAPSSWSHQLLYNAQHLPPSTTFTSPNPTPPNAPLPISTTLSSLYLPSTPYLQSHLHLLSSQLGSSLTLPYPNSHPSDEDIPRLIKAQARQAMQREEVHQPSGDSPLPCDIAYPFTHHSAALRQHLLTLSSLHSSFTRLTASITHHPSLHRLLLDISSAYVELFTSLLSTLFTLNSHYHLHLHHLTFHLHSLHSSHSLDTATLQQKIHLLSSSHRSTDHLQAIEAQQRQHLEDLIATLTSTLRGQAADALTAPISTTPPPHDLGQSANFQSHHLSLLLDALVKERECGEDGRLQLSQLLIEGKQSARDLWTNTLQKKKEDAAVKQKEREDQEKKQRAMLPSPRSPRLPSSASAHQFTMAGYTLVPLLSRFLYSPDSAFTPRGSLSSRLTPGPPVQSLNAQLLSLLVSLPPSTGVKAFPTHVLQVITTSYHPQLPPAQKHLVSLFTQCTAHRTAPLPQLLLPLVATGGTRGGGVSSLTLQLMAFGLRHLRPQLDKDLCLSLAALQAAVSGLVGRLYQPTSFSLLGQVRAWLDAQGEGLVNIVGFLLELAAKYGGLLMEWMKVVGGGKVGLEEMDLMMGEVDKGKWQATGKDERAKVYVEWIDRCVEGKVEGQTEESMAFIDVLCLRGWWFRNPQPPHAG